MPVAGAEQVEAQPGERKGDSSTDYHFNPEGLPKAEITVRAQVYRILISELVICVRIGAGLRLSYQSK